MSLYTVTSTARLAQSSPSVSLEKGAYRLRAPPIRNMPRSRRGSSRSHDVAPSTYSKRMAMLVVFLITATIASFGAAYYLFTTRWAAPALASAAPDLLSDDAPSVPQAAPNVVHFDDTRTALALGSAAGLLGSWGLRGSSMLWSAGAEPEKYLAYLPHSGFHNQRIAFENALVLSRLLNRTLLVPPVRIGNRPLTYVPYDELSVLLANSTKDHLGHCVRLQEDEEIPEECLDYYEYTHVPWDWLVDLAPIKAEQKLVQRWNLTDAWLRDELQLCADDVFALHDVDRNHYGFQDFVAFSNTLARKYAQTVHVSTLAARPERLLQLGTLFGSSRLHLRDKAHGAVRAAVRRSMAFSNAQLVRTAEAVRVALGGTYLAAHVRVGDGPFAARAEENVRLVWWKLMTGPLGFEEEDALELEYELFLDDEDDALEFDADADGPPHLAVDVPAQRAPHPALPPLPAPPAPASVPACRRARHTAAHLQQFNIPLFLATDAPGSAVLGRLTRTFPCTYYLADFGAETRGVRGLVSGRDGVPMGEFLVPFLEAMVAGRAWGVVGTERSTFSAFVTDVLWRTYHGWDIVQRG